MNDPLHAPKDASEDLKEYAGGWMTERKNTGIPLFLKISTPIISLFAAGYLVIQMNGDIHHPGRGFLVEQFNRVSHPAPVVNILVAALVLVYTIIVARFVFSTHKEG